MAGDRKWCGNQRCPNLVEIQFKMVFSGAGCPIHGPPPRGRLAQIETPSRRRCTLAETNASGNAFDLQCDLPRRLINDDLEEVAGEILGTVDRDRSTSKSNRSRCNFDKGFTSF